MLRSWSTASGSLLRANRSQGLQRKPRCVTVRYNSVTSNIDLSSEERALYKSPPFRERLRASSGSIILWTAVSSLSLHLYLRRLDFKDSKEKEWAKIQGVKDLTAALRSGQVHPEDHEFAKSLESLGMPTSELGPLESTIRLAKGPPPGQPKDIPSASRSAVSTEPDQIRNIPSAFAQDPIFGQRARTENTSNANSKPRKNLDKAFTIT